MVSAEGANLTDFLFTVSSGIFNKGTKLIASASLTAIPLGGVTVPRYAIFINTDPTNFITLYNGNGATSASKMAKLLAGYPAIIPLDPACVPYAQADTADSNLLFCIFSA